MLYRETECWLMNFVGTASGVFNFNRKFQQVGCFARRCALEFFSGKHLVFTGDDVVVHDGQNAESVLTQRAKKLISGIVDSTNVARSFVAINWPLFELWVCVPRKGQTYPDLAVVWNWKLNVWGVRDLPSAAFIAEGTVPPPTTGQIWDQALGAWDVQTAIWGERAAAPAQPQMVIAAPNVTKLYVAGQGTQFGGVNPVCYVEKQNVGFPIKSNGPPDFTRMKQVLSVWPRIEGTHGGVVNVHLGQQHKINGPITNEKVRAYVIGESEMLDFSDSESSRLSSLRFESNSAVQWKLSSYDVDVIDRGTYG
jgi:hypothetical protein